MSESKRYPSEQEIATARSAILINLSVTPKIKELTDSGMALEDAIKELCLDGFVVNMSRTLGAAYMWSNFYASLLHTNTGI